MNTTNPIEGLVPQASPQADFAERAVYHMNNEGLAFCARRARLLTINDRSPSSWAPNRP